MPPDVVSIAVTTGIGVSVFAGIISGVCYVLVCGFTNKRKREPELQWLCAVCGTYLRLRIKEKIKIVICSKCEHRVCKRKCSRRDSQTKEWICYTCLKQPSFFQGILSIFPLFKKKKIVPQSIQMGKTVNEDVSIKQQKDSVRDFIEKLVSTIVGGSVDDASVFKMYSDTPYNVIFDRYYQDLSNAITDLSSSLQISMQNASLSDQSPSSAHTSLKLLIEKIIREAIHLPNFRKPVENPTAPEDRTYEDLLATAILNKIINKQEGTSTWSSAENVVDNDRFSTKYRTRNRNSDSRWNETESVSGSSIDDYVYSDSSHSSAKYVDRVHLTIQQRIEQAPSISEHDDVDSDFNYFSEKSSLIDANSNWYLQKRQFSTNSPVPVPMLVPNPLTSAKVLIGDKEIDDTSDLSDANSECNDVHTNLIIDSSLTIEEKATNNYSSDEQTSFDSGVREDRDDCSENLYYAESKNFAGADEKTWDVEDSSLFSTYSNVEKDSEYLEKYSSLPTKIPASSLQKTHYHALNREKENQDLEDYEDDSSLFYEGSYSKREKEKWKHPVNMPHNPYSEENIRKRILTNKRFGRDYYTKQASLPSGRLKSQEEDDHFSGEEEDGEHWAQPVIITDDSLIVFENNDVIEKQPSEEDEKTFEVRVNEKEVHLFDESELENTLQIKTNKKEAFTSFLVDLTDQDVENSVEDEIPETQVEIPPKVDYFNHPLLSKQFSNADEIEKPEPLIRILVNEKEAFSPEVDEAPTNVDGNVFSKFDNKPNEIKTFVPTPVPRKAKPAPEDTPPLNRQLSSSAIVPKKSDNTLIKKIYSNPVVRNFALTNREQIPGALEEPKLAATNGVATVPLPLKKTVEKTEAIKLDKKPFAVERKEDVAVTHNFSLEFSDNESVKEQDEGDIDFRDLKERRLVANLLGKFSQSVPSLVKTPEEDGKKEIKERFKQNREIFTQPEGETNRETEVSYFASVKKLRQLFENNDASRYKKDKPVHSLTARSISKEMKDKLSSRDGIYCSKSEC